MTRPSVGSALRAVAIAIAVLAFIDPAAITSRTGRPLVAVIAADARDDSAAATRVAATLRGGATVIEAPFAGADATVIVGERLPSGAAESTGPAFAVVPAGGARVSIEMAVAPPRASSDATIPVTVRVRAAAGQRVDVSLASGGVELDHSTLAVRSSEQRATVELHAAAADTGVQHLRLVASANGVPAASADLAVDVRRRRWSVLFYDARPSWSSRFVRMAVERDPRVAVSGRVMTSRAVSSDAGDPPAQLDEDAAVRRYDAIVVGAPRALSERAVQGLERFMRTRGGSVVLVLDEAAGGGTAPFDRLAGAAGWTTRGNADPVRITPVGGAGWNLRATQVSWPGRPPAGAATLAESRVTAADRTPHPVVWATSVGAGRLVVSGALDAWRFRDSTWSTFDRAWQEVIADAAARAPEPVSISVVPAVRPRAFTTLRVTVRDVALRAGASAQAQSLRASVGAALVTPTGRRIAVPVWPSGSVGEFEGTVRAPDVPGTYRVEVASGNERASVPLIVASDASTPIGTGRAALGAWVSLTGGKIVPSDQLGGLVGAIDAATRATPRAEPWHPMRSPWWIIPFALALSAEWYLRRRRGAP